jgi:hypothetical protein
MDNNAPLAKQGKRGQDAKLLGAIGPTPCQFDNHNSTAVVLFFTLPELHYYIPNI